MDDLHKTRLHRARLQYETLLSNSSRREVASHNAFQVENFRGSSKFDDINQSRLRAGSNERPHMSFQPDGRKGSVSAVVPSTSLFKGESRPSNTGQCPSSPTVTAGTSSRPTCNLFQGIHEIDLSKGSVGDRNSILIRKDETSGKQIKPLDTICSSEKYCLSRACFEMVYQTPFEENMVILNAR